jgi:hypothetical protein
MTDETYGVFAFLGAIAAAGALWFKILEGRSARRVLRMLERDGFTVRRGPDGGVEIVKPDGTVVPAPPADE